MINQGFLLNNQLTDFSAAPSVDSQPVANRLQPGKRPRSSMAPTLVFRKNADGSRGDFVMTAGSPGGAAIIQYVAKTLVGVLDWNMDAQQAVSMVDFGGNNMATMVGGEHPNLDLRATAAGRAGDSDLLVTGLRALGHSVNLAAQSSGLSAIVKPAPTPASQAAPIRAVKGWCWAIPFALERPVIARRQRQLASGPIGATARNVEPDCPVRK